MSNPPDSASILSRPFSWRRFLICAALAGAGLLWTQGASKADESIASKPETAAKQRYKIAVCDWMILKRQKLGAFQLTKDIGADGVEVDMGGLGERATFDSHLGDPE